MLDSDLHVHVTFIAALGSWHNYEAQETEA